MLSRCGTGCGARAKASHVSSAGGPGNPTPGGACHRALGAQLRGLIENWPESAEPGTEIAASGAPQGARSPTMGARCTKVHLWNDQASFVALHSLFSQRGNRTEGHRRERKPGQEPFVEFLTLNLPTPTRAQTHAVTLRCEAAKPPSLEGRRPERQWPHPSRLAADAARTSG